MIGQLDLFLADEFDGEQKIMALTSASYYPSGFRREYGFSHVSVEGEIVVQVLEGNAVVATPRAKAVRRGPSDTLTDDEI